MSSSSSSNSPRWTFRRWVLIDSSQSGGDNVTNSSYFPLKHHFGPIVMPLSQRVSNASWKYSSCTREPSDQWSSGSNDRVASVFMTLCHGSRKWLWHIFIGMSEKSSIGNSQFIESKSGDVLHSNGFTNWTAHLFVWRASLSHPLIPQPEWGFKTDAYIIDNNYTVYQPIQYCISTQTL